jgi:hypothetical protein
MDSEQHRAASVRGGKAADEPAKQFGTVFPLHPNDWLALLLLRREADQCFGAARPNDKPAAPASGPRH